MKVYIVGYAGNMGARYRAILNMLGHEWAGIDVGKQATTFTPDNADAILITSPTDKHVTHIKEYATLGKPILCEKPFTKDLWELERLFLFTKTTGATVQMVDQYAHLQFSLTATDPTTYDYFKHGSDGLEWDCINIVKHARGPVELKEQSPIWRCHINGTRLWPGDMDHAYVSMISDWLRAPKDETDAIYRAHDKVHKLRDSLLCKQF